MDVFTLPNRRCVQKYAGQRSRESLELCECTHLCKHRSSFFPVCDFQNLFTQFQTVVLRKERIAKIENVRWGFRPFNLIFAGIFVTGDNSLNKIHTGRP